LYFTGQRAAVLDEFHPKGAKDELKEELDDLAVRTGSQAGEPVGGKP
jgi:hypothetical protein